MPGDWYALVMIGVVALPFMAVIFIVRLLWCIGRIRAAVKLARASVHTMAMIVGNRSEPWGRTQFGRRSQAFRPLLRYTTTEGWSVTAPGATAMRFPFFVGAFVPVRYHPGEPDLVEITSGPGAGTDAYQALFIALLGLGVVTVNSCFWGHMIGIFGRG